MSAGMRVLGGGASQMPGQIGAVLLVEFQQGTRKARILPVVTVVFRPFDVTLPARARGEGESADRLGGAPPLVTQNGAPGSEPVDRDAPLVLADAARRGTPQDVAGKRERAGGFPARRLRGGGGGRGDRHVAPPVSMRMCPNRMAPVRLSTLHTKSSSKVSTVTSPGSGDPSGMSTGTAPSSPASTG